MTHRDDTTEPSRFNRRGYLAKVGVGVVALGAPGALAAPGQAAPRRAAAAHHAARHQLGVTQHFGRMFERMRPFAVAGTKGLEASLVDIGSRGGILDARDALERGPADLITDPSLSAHNPNNPTHTAGTTFFGQFMDHDMTFDRGPPADHLALPADDPARVRSRRDRQPRAADRAAGADAASAPDLGAALGPVDRAQVRRLRARTRRSRRPAPLRARARALHAALVLRPQGGRARRGRAPTRARRRTARRRGGRRPAGERLGVVPRAFDRDWRPTLPSRARGDFRMVDFLTFAGVDPKSRGQ